MRTDRAGGSECGSKGWERALIDIVARHRAQPFEWAHQTVSRCRLRRSSRLPAPILGRTLRLRQPLIGGALLKAQGYRDLAEAFADRFTEVAVSFAQRGDVGVIEDDGAFCGALFLASGVAGKTETGLHIFTRDRVARAFQVD